MLKASAKRPVTPVKLEDAPILHWCKAAYETVITPSSPDGPVDCTIEGGSDNGEFPFFGIVPPKNKSLMPGDIILEVQGQKVAGYTQRDVVSLLKHCVRNGGSAEVKVIKSNYLTKDLRCFLNTRFQKGSIDHDLQNTIRDNLYQRTVPCTTRIPRPGEISGVDYTFLNVDEFIVLERSGNLLESGIYEGNHYGTPMPPKENYHSPIWRNNSSGPPNNFILPGAHASSEGKRRRNRSNVEAMASKTAENGDCSTPGTNCNTRSSTPVSGYSTAYPNCNPVAENLQIGNAPFCELGPLPENWEQSFTGNGEPYFIDHNTGTSQWMDPRLSRMQRKTADDSIDSDLPYGWEKIKDPHYGTYYIDHVNRRTQYETPILLGRKNECATDAGHLAATAWHRHPDHPPIVPFASRNSSLTHTSNCSNPNNPSSSATNNSDTFLIAETADAKDGKVANGTAVKEAIAGHRSPLTVEKKDKPIGALVASEQQQKFNVPNHINSVAKPKGIFTRNPEELRGSFIHTTLIKSSQGLGFTIVGGGDGEEFLQIKDIVPNGPAWCNGRLLMGDVLVHVNNECVLGYTHQRIIALFQTIPVGEVVQLAICRGYPFPFDPSDPNTQIVTTVAVSVANTNTFHNPYLYRQENNKPTDSIARSAKSMPDLGSKPPEGAFKNNSAGVLNPFAEELAQTVGIMIPEFLTVEIVKGTAGFGFTIADSSYGQKVKKILDRPRCKQLQENDLLCAINGRDVRTIPHVDVVQMLKDCPCGEVAEIIVQRGGFFSPARPKPKPKLPINEELNSYSLGNVGHSSFENSHQQMNSKSNGSYRSKTPTAELYSSRDKEPVSIARPKTPIVDARNWSMASTDLYQNNSTYQPSNNADFYSHTNGNTLNNNVSDLPFYPSTNNSSQLQTRANSTSIYNHQAIDYNNPDRHGNPSWYSDQSRGRSWHNNYRDDQFSRTFSDSHVFKNFTSEPMRRPLFDANSSFPGIDSRIYRPDMNNFAFQPLRREEGVFVNSSYSMPDGHYFGNTKGGFMYNQPYYMPTYHSQNLSASSEMQVNNGHNLNNPSLSSSVKSDSVLMKKHGTSFEHEQPIPYFNGDARGSYRNTNCKMNACGNRNSSYFMDMSVTLQRQENGFGFRIIGGTEEGSQVAVGFIVPEGSADLDGTIKSGDEIMAVDGQSVLNTPHHHVVQLMTAASDRGKVLLNLRRRIFHPENSNNNAKPEEYSASYNVTITRNISEGFGFVIISSQSKSGSTIGRIIEGSPAERCGTLRVGDSILAVNGISITNMQHPDIVNLIKDCGYSITLTIEDETSSVSLSQKGEDTSLDQDDFYQAVLLHRGSKGFGFSIRGGKEFQNMPLFVLRIAESGPAQEDGKLKVGDQIIEINNISTKDMTHADAIDLIKKGGATVQLLTKRSNHNP